MKYNTSNQKEANEAFTYLTELIGKEALVEVKKISPTRSLNQNSYLHLLLEAFGAHFGYTTDESKILYKREVNSRLYVYTKNNQKFLRSSADLTKEEMQISIDKFMQYSSENGYDLPLADSPEHIMFAENQIERNERYL